MKKRPLTEAMKRCLDYIKEHKKIIRYPGGFWARPDVPIVKYNFPARENYFGASTIYGLIARGFFVAEYSDRGYAKSVTLKKE